MEIPCISAEGWLTPHKPMRRFGSGGKGPAAASRELKQLVKALHAAGIEGLLDLVYNHTVEGEFDPKLL